MFHGNFNFKYFTICLLIIAACLTISAQKKTVQKDVLAAFEKNIKQGKLAETEKPLLDFALTNPNNVRALELVGRLRFRQGRFEEANALYSRVLSLDANFTAAKINYGIILLQFGKTDEARQFLTSVNSSEIKDSATLLSLAKSLTLVGEFQKSREIAEKLPVILKNSEALPILAVCYIGLGERTKFDALLPLVKKQAAKTDISLKFVEVLLNAKLNAQAVELLRAVVLAAPKNARALVMLAKEEVFAKDFPQAKAHLDRAEILQPQSAEVFFVKAIFANAQNDAVSALNFLEKATTLEPTSTFLLSQFAVAAMRANQARKAIEASEKLVNLKPDEPDFLYLYGAASLQGGNLQKAQTVLETFMQLRPADSRGCLALGLTLAAQRDQIEPARQQLRRCLEINPANYEAKYQLGLSYKAQGDTPNAIKFLEETVALMPNYPIALRDLGTVYLQAGEEAKARTVLEKSVNLSPNDAETHFQLSRLYNLIGETGLAKKHLEMFQKLRNTGGNLMQ